MEKARELEKEKKYRKEQKAQRENKVLFFNKKFEIEGIRRKGYVKTTNL